MVKLEPQGTKIIVQTILTEHTETEGGIIAVDFTLEKGEVIEVGAEVKNLYNVGDIVLFPEGVGQSINYQKKACKWLDGRGFPNGDIWAKEIEEK
jgi:co-chaperonin GroES (HSP10)